MTGKDLGELTQTARQAKANIDRLAARAPAFAIEQAALAGLLGAADDLTEAARRLDLYAEEGDGPWAGVAAETGGYIFSPLKPGATQPTRLAEHLLHPPTPRR